ncbi:nitroreductase [Acidaminobacter sp. JC074]|uniref:nitroreductase family protein n=1 Tax=Acidaminobacter sp. JC074 TaxID=2530199 RepID=UPI001F114F1F|nr:nitroreductase family protein [Acidaminobacter sp. JC074]MCH4885921.1 nitroreductase [Acidaminobacter sp. JC074]
MREYNYDILKEIKDRWSPRAFSPEPVDQDDLMAILEAARYAPSCFNEQPWRFIIGQGESLQVMQSLLLEGNLKWAKNAPVLILICSKTTFDRNDKENKYHQFDAGTAWGFLSLEAISRGYYTHAMAGYRKKLARELLNIPEDIVPIAMVALGKPGDINALEDEIRQKEKPNTRKDLSDLIMEVRINE